MSRTATQVSLDYLIRRHINGLPPLPATTDPDDVGDLQQMRVEDAKEEITYQAEAPVARTARSEDLRLAHELDDFFSLPPVIADLRAMRTANANAKAEFEEFFNGIMKESVGT